MKIPKLRAYDFNREIECDVVSIDYRLNELGLKPVNSENVYYTRQPNVFIWVYTYAPWNPWEGKDGNSDEDNTDCWNHYHAGNLE